MDGSNPLPDDLAECHELLLAAYRQSIQLEQQVATSRQEAAQLNRVLDETAASFEELKQEHATTLDELAWYKRWAFGRRRERFTEGEQGIELNCSQLNRLLGGFDLRTGRRRKRYRRVG